MKPCITLLLGSSSQIYLKLFNNNNNNLFNLSSFTLSEADYRLTAWSKTICSCAISVVFCFLVVVVLCGVPDWPSVTMVLCCLCERASQLKCKTHLTGF